MAYCFARFKTRCSHVELIVSAIPFPLEKDDDPYDLVSNGLIKALKQFHLCTISKSTTGTNALPLLSSFSLTFSG